MSGRRTWQHPKYPIFPCIAEIFGKNRLISPFAVVFAPVDKWINVSRSLLSSPRQPEGRRSLSPPLSPTSLNQPFSFFFLFIFFFSFLSSPVNRPSGWLYKLRFMELEEFLSFPFSRLSFAALQLSNCVRRRSVQGRLLRFNETFASFALLSFLQENSLTLTRQRMARG